MENISFNEFKKLDIRIAKIIKAEPIEGADKLLRLRIDLGDEERQLVAGLANHYSTADLVGKSIVVLANLEPKELMGVESQGMLLAATGDDKIALLRPDKDVNPGTKIT